MSWSKRRAAASSANPNIPLPLGISFFTFHAISYVVDVYKRNARRSSVAAAVRALHPALSAAHRRPDHPLARRSRRSSRERASACRFRLRACVRFVVGLGKKLLIANPSARAADQIFALPAAQLTAPRGWLGLVCYTLQIYFDFSGYSDMAIGLARMFGFRFPENFNYPYAALDPGFLAALAYLAVELVPRLRLYPAGRQPRRCLARRFNLWLVFLLCGAWHGASWNFVLWGAWHGLFLSLERVPAAERALARCPALVRHAYVLVIVLVGWVFFRSLTLDQAFDILTRMFALQPGSGTMLSLSANIAAPTMLLIAGATLFSFPLWPRLAAVPRSGAVWGALRAGGVGIITLLCIATMTVDQNNPFIYFRF